MHKNSTFPHVSCSTRTTAALIAALEVWDSPILLNNALQLPKARLLCERLRDGISNRTISTRFQLLLSMRQRPLPRSESVWAAKRVSVAGVLRSVIEPPFD
jgi:hypothetical protein